MKHGQCERCLELARERDDLLKANQVLHNLLTNREAEIAALRGVAKRPLPVDETALADFICETQDRLGPGCDELAIAQAILRIFCVRTLTSTAQSPLPCPYAIDGCVLENQEVGPCLCANPDLCAVSSTKRCEPHPNCPCENGRCIYPGCTCAVTSTDRCEGK
jgi:hypothetical protein